ncbi:MAG: DUF1622 domain-containing protein [Deltaproteobacteria bacterium]|nr:DUF1622 domain-containing protein [Deltaproteobacteria bacterium]
MDSSAIIQGVSVGGELLGVGVIAVGMVAGTLRYLWALALKNPRAYIDFRHATARTLLLGLEVLVAADVVRTVAVAPTLGNIAVLAGIVAIRTFLGWTLQLEMEGRWPWQRSAPGQRHSQCDQ